MMRNASKFRVALERFFLFAGLAALAVAAWFLLGADVWRKWEDRRFDQAVAQEAAGNTPESPRKAAQPRPASGDIIGRLSIPRLRVKSVVREGAGDGVLSLALGHIKGTAMPGDQGNVGVAGHRDTLFRGLRDVATHDQIVFETLDKKYVYQVTSTEIVPPSAVEVLQPGSRPELTLVTCYPFEYIGSAPDRFIVKARLLEDSTEALAKPPRFTAPVPVPQPVVPRPAPPRRVAFSVTTGHSRELVPGKVWFGVSGVDSGDSRLDGWLWIAPARRTIWLRDENTNIPVTFRSGPDEYALTVTRTTSNSVSGFLVAGNKPAYDMKPLPYRASLR